ncbi:MAG: permease-like cell division protein FtsX [Bacteroidota bacterium]|nr:permease-like cell division protein FtsX [Bacteroidota bacterium]MDP4234807.1 permease-like cell division protein FtsX [Bacteroidota bacterium]MDP4244173.1 permease-like cell division protein FtsX [Bacteroidota bacterium]MDP4289345.1 permease-like cell division protein FtsX [Bacteroidota bacterium]
MNFVIRETWRAIRNAPMTWVMSCITLAVALSVTGLFAGAAWKARIALRTARETLPIEAFFDPNVSNDDAQATIDRAIKPLPGLRSVTFTSREAALADYSSSTGEDVERILGLNPLPASATIRLTNATSAGAEHIIEQLRATSGIAEVRADIDLLRVLEDRSRSVARFALVVGGLLLASSIFFLVTAARLTMIARADTVRVMRQLGARHWKIVLPVAFEGSLAGLFAGVIAGGLLFVFMKNSAGISGVFIAAPQSNHYALLLGAISGIGLLLGMIPATAIGFAASRRR